MAEDIFAEDASVASDGLPPPAYQPKVAAFEPQPTELEAEPEAFVAPARLPRDTIALKHWPVCVPQPKGAPAAERTLQDPHRTAAERRVSGSIL